jgi:hypothetical protein
MEVVEQVKMIVIWGCIWHKVMICDWNNGGLHTCGEEVKGSLDLGEDLKEATMCSS